MSRKKIVLIEWIILLLVVAGLAALIIHGIVSLGSSRGEGKKAAINQENGTETQMQAGTEAEGAVEADNSSDGDTEDVSESGQRVSEAEEREPADGQGSSESDSQGSADGQGSSESDSQGPADEQDSTEAGPVHTYTFSFAGDSTIGSLLEWQGNVAGDFQSVVGTDYTYPLSNVRDIFSKDDFTMVNLEGTFTTSNYAVVKPYRFKGDPSYVQVLTEGSVEAVSCSNNHADDFLDQGVQDTFATLDGAGILHARAGSPLIHELPGGLQIGIVSYNTVENWQGEYAWRTAVQTDISACKDAGCDLIIGFMHWGTVEYLKEPEAWEVQFAHDMTTWGCNLIVGGHAHILQRMEIYNDVPIFYSMGNFCYGGNLNPDDKDSVIVQAEFTYNSETGEVSRSGLDVIPCLISTRTDLNDYRPTPCAEDSADYQRIIGRLQFTKS